jgi:hypothetical protein
MGAKITLQVVKIYKEISVVKKAGKNAFWLFKFGLLMTLFAILFNLKNGGAKVGEAMVVTFLGFAAISGTIFVLSVLFYAMCSIFSKTDLDEVADGGYAGYLDQNTRKIGMLKKLALWYSSKTKRQRNVLRLTALLLSVCLGPITLIFVAPWLVPLMLYLEFNVDEKE